MAGRAGWTARAWLSVRWGGGLGEVAEPEKTKREAGKVMDVVFATASWSLHMGCAGRNRAQRLRKAIYVRGDFIFV